MRELPESETYEEGLLFWPYKYSLETVLNRISALAPIGGTLLDIMCGPGYLLGLISKRRMDLRLTGVDIDERYVGHGKAVYPEEIDFQLGDVLDWKASEQFDVVVCTGALHHVPYDQQEAAIANIASLVKQGGVVVLSDCYVDDYTNETERKLAAAKLGYEYLINTITNGAPDRVIAWTIGILENDVMMEEFKPSLPKRLALLERHFASVTTTQPWPDSDSGYGDYIHICRR